MNNLPLKLQKRLDKLIYKFSENLVSTYIFGSCLTQDIIKCNDIDLVLVVKNDISFDEAYSKLINIKDCGVLNISPLEIKYRSGPMPPPPPPPRPPRVDVNLPIHIILVREENLFGSEFYEQNRTSMKKLISQSTSKILKAA